MSGRKIVTWAALIAVVALAAAAGWRGLRSEMDRQRGVDGFEVYLRGKDICTLAFEDGVVWAGGIDGLFRLERVRAEDVTGGRSGRNGSESTEPQSGNSVGGRSGKPASESSAADDGNSIGGSASYTVSEVGDFRQVKAVLATEEGLWIGHDAGLSLLRGGSIRTMTTADGLPDDRVNALCLDAEGKLWAGTWGGAAIVDDGQVEKVLRTADGLADDMVNVIFGDSSGSVWLGSYVAPRGGLTVINGAKMQSFSTQNGLLHANINAIMETSEKHVLVGGGLYTKGGGTFFTIDDGTWTVASSIRKEDGLAGEKIRALFRDHRGRIWIGSEYDGLVVLENLSVDASGVAGFVARRLLTQENGLPNNEVKVVGESETGDIWVGTRSGLLKIEEGG